MDIFKKKFIENQYEKIGPLEIEDFIAIQNLIYGKKVFDIQSFETIYRVDGGNKTTLITPDQIKPGDTIKIVGAQVQKVGI